jgi:heterotetrameric sarcosine oxidase gamma subunit
VAEAPVARSPVSPADPQVVVDGWLVSGRRSEAALTLTDLTPLTKVAVRAVPDGPMADALSTPGPGVLVTSVVPGEWLVLAEPGEQAAVLGWLEPVAGRSERLATVVDLTHGRALLRLSGRAAAAVLAKECALDLGDRGCSDGRALRTAVAGVAVDVVRQNRDGVPSYLLHCEWSSGQYLFDVLLDSGSEFGIDVDGFIPPGLSTTRGGTS